MDWEGNRFTCFVGTVIQVVARAVQIIEDTIAGVVTKIGDFFGGLF
jgi:hypothetical protein